MTASIILAAILVGPGSVVLQNDKGSAEISLKGGRILSWRPAGGREVFFMPEQPIAANGDWCHGGMPVCWPWFGRRDGVIHGFVREQSFKVSARADGPGESSVTFVTEVLAGEKASFPHAAKLELAVTLSDRLSLVVRTTNTGTETFTYSTGIHPYFSVTGYSDARIIGVEPQPFAVADGMDKAFARREGAIVLETPERRLRLTANGNSNVVVWSPGTVEPPNRNLRPGDPAKFVAVGPFCSKTEGAITLAPGKTHALAFEIAVDRTALATVSTVEDRPGYNSWPMIQTVGNRVVCTYSRGTRHDVFEGVRGAWAKWSDDCGKTWRGPFPVADSPTHGETPIGKGLDSQGAALFWIRAYGSPGHRMSLYRTTDGEKFECLATPELKPMPVQITDVFHVPGRGMVALWFAGNYRDDDAHKCWGELVSADGGRTWRQRTIGSELSKDEWPTEPSVARLKDGRLLCIARSERYAPEKALQWQLESADGGRTWTKSATNIRDVMASTPSLVYEPASDRLYNYYYERGKCMLKFRVAAPEAVWGKPLAWPEPSVVARGSDSPWDSGNACATAGFGKHFIAYYTGRHPNTSVVVAVVEAK